MTVSDGTESAAPIAPETPASNPAPEADPTTDLNALEESQGQGEQATEPEVEYEDLEWDGKQWSIPKALKPGFMMQKDYTQKTMAVAAKDKAVQQQERQLAEYASLTVGEQKVVGQLGWIDDRIASFIGADTPLEAINNIDWQAWRIRDRAAADRAAQALPKLLAARQRLEGQARELGTARTQAQQQADAAKRQRTREYAEQNITGWNDELDAKITAFAAERFGYESKEELLVDVNPRTYAAWHSAWLAHEAGKQQQQPTKDAPKAPAIAPLTVVGSRSSPGAKRPLAAVDDMEEYVRRRRAGEKG